MADLKITQLPATTTPATTDIIPIVTDPGGTPVTQKVELQELGTKIGNVSALQIVAAHALSSFTNTSGTHEVGSTAAGFSLNWTYNRNGDDPTSQSINQGIGAVAVALRTVAVGAGLTTSTTYTISAVGDDSNPSSANSTVSFLRKRYWGVHDTVITTGAGIMSLIQPQNEEFASSRPVSKVFDASIGTPPNYLYFAYPTSFGAVASATFNGFPFTAYTVVSDSLTNASGDTTTYYIVRTDNTFAGSGLTWALA